MYQNREIKGNNAIIRYMRNKLNQFLSGRYGNDELNRFLFYIECICLFLMIFTHYFIWEILFIVSAVLYCYRAFSKNYVARSIENQKYKHYKVKVQHQFKVIQKNVKEKDYKYVVCPSCAQIIRLPKKKGKLEVKCPTCKKKFDKRT